MPFGRSAEPEPLLGDFDRKDEMPLVRAVNPGSDDETVALVWQCARFTFCGGEGRAALTDAMAAVSPAWQCQFFGTPARRADVRRQAEAHKEQRSLFDAGA